MRGKLEIFEYDSEKKIDRAMSRRDLMQGSF
jgi:hypothetical protein